MHMDTKRLPHVYNLHIHACILFQACVSHGPGARQQIFLGYSRVVPPAMLTHRQLILGALLWKPLHPSMPPFRAHTHHQTQGGGLGRARASLALSFARGLQYGLARLSPFPRGGRHTLAAFPTLTIPSSYLHMDTRKY